MSSHYEANRIKRSRQSLRRGRDIMPRPGNSLRRLRFESLEDRSMLASGNLDLSFGEDGTGLVLTDLAACQETVLKTFVEADGRFTVVGTSSSGRSVAILRYTSDGRIDTNAVLGGTIVTSFFSPTFIATSAAQQADGKFVVVGYLDVGGSQSWALTRFNGDGTLDANFGLNGRITGGGSYATDVAIQADGRIVVVGTRFGSSSARLGFEIKRYTVNGVLDKSQFTNFSARDDVARAVAIQDDGSIVVAGRAFQTDAFDSDFALARYRPDLTLDQNFGTSGVVTTDFGFFQQNGGDVASDVLIQPDGKIVAGGHVFNGSSIDVGLARYLPDGSPDPLFGAAGIAMTDFGGSEGASSLILQNDGTIIAVGGNGADFTMVRYTAAGQLDEMFGSHGKVVTDFGFGSDEAANVVLQPGGEILVVGRAFSGTSNDVALARYLPGRSSYHGTVMADGPIAYWRLGEAGGTTAFDASGHDAIGTYRNGVVLGQRGIVFNEPDTAARFDGTNDYAEFQNPIGDDFTLEAWINTSANSLSGTQAYQGNPILWSDVGFGGTGNDWALGVLNNRLAFFTGGPDTTILGATRLNDGQWHHVVATRSKGQFKKIYVDGILEGVGPTNNNTLRDNPNILLGGNTLDNRYFNGRIDEVALYDRALSDSEIFDHFRSARPDSLVNHGLDGEFFFDTVTGLYWYDLAQFEGKPRPEIDLFVTESPIWEWASSTAIEDLLEKSSRGGIPLDQVMGRQQFTLINGGLRWIGYHSHGGQPDGWLAQTGPSQSQIVSTGHQFNVTTWNSNATTGAWLISTTDPVAAQVEPTVSIGGISVVEGDGEYEVFFPVTLSEASEREVRVDFETTDGTAMASVHVGHAFALNDYKGVQGTLVFEPGETTKAISVTIYGDRLPTVDRHFFLKLTAAMNAQLGTTQAVGSIADDDPQQTLAGTKAVLDGSSKPISGVTVITHGFQLDGDGESLLSLAGAIHQRIGGWLVDYDLVTTGEVGTFNQPHYVPHPGTTDELVLLFDWGPESNEGSSGWGEAAGDALFSILVGLDLVRPSAGALNRQIHFIGHSFGAAVVSDAIERLARFGVPVDHVTYLDPHDFDQSLGFPVKIDTAQELWKLGAPHGDSAANGYGATVWNNVAFADAYYQTRGSNAGSSAPDAVVPEGRPIPGAVNVWLDIELPDESILPYDASDNEAGDHSYVWNGFYLATVLGGLPHNVPPPQQHIDFSQTGYALSRAAHPSASPNRPSHLDPAGSFFPNSPGTQDHKWSSEALVQGYQGDTREGLPESGVTPEKINEGRFDPAWEPLVILNGDFQHAGTGHDGNLSVDQNLVPGWSHHGGDGAGVVGAEDGNYYLHLDSIRFGRTHNLLYIPVDAAALLFKIRVREAGIGDRLEVRFGNESISSIPLDAEEFSTQVCESFGVSIDERIRGTVQTLFFQIVHSGLSLDESYVHIDDIEFSNSPVNHSPRIADQSFFVRENSPASIVVGLVAATDVNSNQSLSYAIIAGNVNGAFSIDPESGRLSVNNAVPLDFEATPAFDLIVQVTDNGSPALSASATITINLVNVFEFEALDVQRGQSQRSFVRYVDLVFEDQTGLEVLLAGRIKLTRFDLTGDNGVDMDLTDLLTADRDRVLFDFGINGVGGNRNSNVGDGYYRIGLDLDGDGGFETEQYFYRLFGDVNGDRRVNSLDVSAINAYIIARSLEGDMNGDGYVDARDRLLAQRANGRRLADGLLVND